MGIFSKFFSKEKKETLDNGLKKTKEGVFSKIAHAIAGKSTIDDDVLDNLEEVLISSDVGVDTTIKIIDRIQETIPTAYPVSSLGCPGRPDKLHFTAEGYRILGRRYADVMMSILNKDAFKAVSYIHLTLPTIFSVYISVVSVSVEKEEKRGVHSIG